MREPGWPERARQHGHHADPDAYLQAALGQHPQHIARDAPMHHAVSAGMTRAPCVRLV
ncbi:hypothetical protein D3C81_1553930 [compost metagenome]